jgi:uncharacterized membrane protein YgcG
MSIRTLVVLAAMLATFVLQPGRADAATCAVACRDETAACISTECQGLTKRPLRHCKRQCKRSLVRDCFADLTACGATMARPPRPSGGGGGSSGGGGGSSGGGW